MQARLAPGEEEGGRRFSGGFGPRRAQKKSPKFLGAEIAYTTGGGWASRPAAPSLRPHAPQGGGAPEISVGPDLKAFLFSDPWTLRELDQQIRWADSELRERHFHQRRIQETLDEAQW